ncbi:S-type anion channel SLAH3 [Platanthera zijinensis]|uniref:S-type anion channel SLAH3 n=1 Tax=Platanthera zijinensis TaxID=2320716 RepID=A0AAP0B322_9ASPA
MAPIFCLELKIYGQWMSEGQRRISKVANLSNHPYIVGNFVGALLGESSGSRKGRCSSLWLVWCTTLCCL